MSSIERGEWGLMFQPIVCSNNFDNANPYPITAVEALFRQSADSNRLDPTYLESVLSECPDELTRYCFDEIARLEGPIRRQFGQDIQVHINLAPSQFTSQLPGIVDHFFGRLSLFQPSNIVLELTERIDVNDIGRVHLHVTEILKTHNGITFSVDDVPTQGSVNLLHGLLNLKGKVGIKFAPDLDLDTYTPAYTLISSSLHPTHAIIEGIDSLARLQEILDNFPWVTGLQGYYFGEPQVVAV